MTHESDSELISIAVYTLTVRLIYAPLFSCIFHSLHFGECGAASVKSENLTNFIHTREQRKIYIRNLSLIR